MNINDEIISLTKAWPCCSLSTVKITDLPERERQFFGGFMPRAITAIALAHHIVDEDEWNWYATRDGGKRCEADDHLKDLCENVKNKLTVGGHFARLVHYPGESGLQFRFVARAAGLGSIGTNAFLFHPTWGPWVHLRVMATTLHLDLKPQFSGSELCDQCGLCISECPVNAISERNFDGMRCRSHLQAIGHYRPSGPRGQYGTCRNCISACPLGKQPLPSRSGIE